jgi:phosphotransferase system enzyme I (PtsI)
VRDIPSPPAPEAVPGGTAPRTLRGVGVSAGVGAGPVHRLAGAVPEPPAGARHGGDADAERAAAVAALEAVAADLEERGERAAELGNADGRDVLGAQAMMARDPGLADGVAARIGEGTAAPRAVFEAFSVYREMLSGAGG